MIDELKVQTKKSVMNFLRELSQNSELYSNSSKGLKPLLQNHEVYVYANLNEVILVELDPRPSRSAELADEEPFNEEHPLWFSESSHRESPVWKLAVTCAIFRERLRRLSHYAPKVWGVLLTGCEVINYDDMVGVWEKLNVSVFDHLLDLKKLNLPINADSELPIASSMSFVFDGSYSHANITDAEKKLRQEMEQMYDNANKPTVYNFDDDDDFDDYETNNAVHTQSTSLENRLKKTIQNENRFASKVAIVSLTVSTGCHTSYYSDGSLTVTLKAEKGAFSNFDDFKCYVYTKDFHSMCNNIAGSETKRSKRCQMSIVMKSYNIWLPGSYFLLLIDHNDMIQRIDFTLDEHLFVTIKEQKDCMPLSQEDILLSCMDNKANNWSQLDIFPGGAQLRQWIIKRKQIDAYNQYRISLHEQGIGYSSNLLIYKRNDDIDECFLNMFYGMSAIKNHYFKHVDCSRLYDSSRPTPYEPLNETLNAVSKEVVCLTNIGALLNAGGKVIMRRVLDFMFDKKSENILWICGTRQETDALLDMYPSLGTLFLRDNRLEQEPYSAFDLVQAFQRRLMQDFLFLSDEAKDALTQAVIKGCANHSLSTWSMEDVNRHVVEEVCPHFLQHGLSTILSNELTKLSVDDLCLGRLSTGFSSFEESMSELNLMIGLDCVKEGIRTMANSARLFLERRNRGLKTNGDMVYHCVFTGNPGTGKTTVAKMLGRIYHSLGLLSKGEVVSVDRARLVGQFIGETEANMKVVLEEAHGNVLFIDEAYTLFVGGTDRKDFGLRVIDSLMTVLSQPNPDMLIVLAGYPKEMESLLSTNPGLAGRFPYRYVFPDYNQEQLMEIARRLLERDDFILTSEAEAAFMETIKETLQKKPKDFSNARWITQMVKNGIVPALANRVFSTGSDDFQHIEASDIRIAYEKLTPKSVEEEKKPSHKKVVGFCA